MLTPGWTAGRLAGCLNLGLWTAAFLSYAAPGALFSGLLEGMVLYLLTCAAVGFGLCTLLFFGIRATGGLGPVLRGAAVLAMVLAALLVHAVFDTWLYAATIGIRAVAKASAHISPVANVFLNNLLMLAGVYVIFAAGVALTLSFFAIQERERSLAEARAMAQEAQLAALRLQINPHFLFNALNAVTALIGVGRTRDAQAVVSRLSDFFRSTLQGRADDLVTLEEELEVIEAYLEIEATRFGARLDVTIEAPEELRASLVPYFILQPLVENAIKHGVAQSARPVSVAVEAARGPAGLRLSVRDDGAGGPSAMGAGVGLKNLEARLRAVFGADYRFQAGRRDGAFVAEIDCPLLWRAEKAA